MQFWMNGIDHITSIGKQRDGPNYGHLQASMGIMKINTATFL